MNPESRIEALTRPRPRMTVFEHLVRTYKHAETHHPDLMEPFAQALNDAEDRDATALVMRHALAVTFRDRYPMPEGFYEQRGRRPD